MSVCFLAPVHGGFCNEQDQMWTFFLSPAAPSVPPEEEAELSKKAELVKEAELVAVTRQLVAERFSGNPAYQLLKARFLSCFTVPALLASLQPITKKTVPEEEEEDEEEEIEEVLKRIKGGKRRGRVSL